MSSSRISTAGVVLDLRQNLDQGEGGVPSVRRVERRESDQPVLPRLGLAIAVGIRAADLDRRALDSGFIAFCPVEDRRLEPALFCPAHVHPRQHLGPVLSVDATGPGVDGQKCVVVVILTRAGVAGSPSDRVDAPSASVCVANLDVHRLIVLVGQLVQFKQIIDLGAHRLPAVDLIAQTCDLAHDSLGLLGIIPETRLDRE